MKTQELISNLKSLLETLTIANGYTSDLAKNGVTYWQDLPSQYDKTFLGFKLISVSYGKEKFALAKEYYFKIEGIIPSDDPASTQSAMIEDLQTLLFNAVLGSRSYTYLFNAIIESETKGVKASKVSLDIRVIAK